jgi:hypothetical protein
MYPINNLRTKQSCTREIQKLSIRHALTYFKFIMSLTKQQFAVRHQVAHTEGET